MILGSQVKGKGRRDTIQGEGGQERAQDSEEKFQVLSQERGRQAQGRRRGLHMASCPVTRRADTGPGRWPWLPSGSH